MLFINYITIYRMSVCLSLSHGDTSILNSEAVMAETHYCNHPDVPGGPSVWEPAVQCESCMKLIIVMLMLFHACMHMDMHYRLFYSLVWLLPLNSHACSIQLWTNQTLPATCSRYQLEYTCMALSAWSLLPLLYGLCDV